MRSDAPSHVLSAGTLCPGLAGGLYRVPLPLGPCSPGSHLAARKKEEREERIGGNRKEAR